jgi:hypothetical protein
VRQHVALHHDLKLLSDRSEEGVVLTNAAILVLSVRIFADGQWDLIKPVTIGHRTPT